MRVQDEIVSLTKRQAEIETEIARCLRDSELSEVSLSSERICRFCGKEKKVRCGWGNFGGHVFYSDCGCEEEARALDIITKIHELESERDNLLKEIKWYRRRTEELMVKCNLGRRFKDRTFASFSKSGFEKAYDAAVKYADGFADNQGEGLILTGTVGTGKTHLAAAITNHIIKTFNIPVMFITSIELFGLLRDFDSHAETLREIKSAPLLVIDDLGKEKITDWNREKLFEIINARYENFLPVVITTNCVPQELETKLGDAIFSRICEMCTGVPMNGADHRRRTKVTAV